jgi:hypothetical protein
MRRIGERHGMVRYPYGVATPLRGGTLVAGFQCGSCSRYHDHLPRDIGYRRPDPYLAIPEEERDSRSDATDDLCIVDGTTFLIRGMLYLPIDDGGRFGWGVWAAVSKDDYCCYLDAWENDTEDETPAFPGYLASALDPYPDSSGLALTIKLRSGGQRPLFTVVSEQHPLGMDQRAGISEEKAHSFVARWA